MGERRDAGEQPRLYRLGARKTVDGALSVREQLDRLEPGLERRLDQILALADKETGPLPLTPRRKTADEAEPRVRL